MHPSMCMGRQWISTDHLCISMNNLVRQWTSIEGGRGVDWGTLRPHKSRPPLKNASTKVQERSGGGGANDTTVGLGPRVFRGCSEASTNRSRKSSADPGASSKGKLFPTHLLVNLEELGFWVRRSLGLSTVCRRWIKLLTSQKSNTCDFHDCRGK